MIDGPHFAGIFFFLSGLLHRYRIIRDRIFSFQIEVEHLEGITFLPADMGGGGLHMLLKKEISSSCLEAVRVREGRRGR